MLNDGSSPELSSYSESAMCATVFRVLKSVVASWLRDISVHRNVFADFQVIHFYRWLRSPSALLYDPALRRMLQNLMRKYFVQLLAEFQRLGATVVYADFGRIVLGTKKRRIVDALSYVSFVCASLRQKELFRSLELNVQHCWQLLVWLDPANYGGIKGKVDGEKQNEGWLFSRMPICLFWKYMNSFSSFQEKNMTKVTTAWWKTKKKRLLQWK